MPRKPTADTTSTADAFIVRATLVPALMSLAGNANWWAPAWAKRIHERFGIEEGGSVEAPDDAGPDDEAAREREPELV